MGGGAFLPVVSYSLASVWCGLSPVNQLILARAVQGWGRTPDTRQFGDY